MEDRRPGQSSIDPRSSILDPRRPSHCVCCAEIGWPVCSQTSRARMMRRRSLGCSREAERGSIVARRACRTAEPAASASRCSRSRRARSAGGLEQAVKQRLQIQRRAADEEHGPATPLDVPAALARLRQPPRDAGRFPRIEHVDEMVRHATAFVARRLCRADVHAAKKRHGIHRDDFRAQTLGEFQRELGLPGPGRARQHAGILERCNHREIPPVLIYRFARTDTEPVAMYRPLRVLMPAQPSKERTTSHPSHPI